MDGGRAPLSSVRLFTITNEYAMAILWFLQRAAPLT